MLSRNNYSPLPQLESINPSQPSPQAGAAADEDPANLVGGGGGGRYARHPLDMPLPPSFAALHPDLARKDTGLTPEDTRNLCKGLFSLCGLVAYASCCLVPKLFYRRIKSTRRCDEWTFREEMVVELLRRMLDTKLDAARGKTKLIERLLRVLPTKVSMKTVRIPSADDDDDDDRPVSLAHWVGCDPPTESSWMQEKEAGVDPGLVVLYFHGGGYTSGSTRLMTFAFASISNALRRRHPGVRVRLCAVDYPLAPEAAFPSAIHATETAYRWLLRQPGISEARVAVGGDSAGGALALALMQKLRSSAPSALRSRVSAVALISPWVDASLAGASVARNGSTDIIRASAARDMVRFYLTGGAVGPEADAYVARFAAHPLVSAVRADLTGFPALYVSGGTREMFYDDIVAFALKAKAAGVDVETDFAEDMVHVYTHLELFLGGRATRGVVKLADFLAKVATSPLDPKDATVVDVEE